MWLYIVIFLLIVLLLIWEYMAHDCLNGKACHANANAPLPDPKDSPAVALDKINEMIRANYTYVSWRQALIVGLIVALPIGYFLQKRGPSPFEWFIVTAIVFVGVYFSYSWIWAHFLYPNGRQLEKNILTLRDIIARETVQEKPKRIPRKTDPKRQSLKK